MTNPFEQDAKKVSRASMLQGFLFAVLLGLVLLMLSRCSYKTPTIYAPFDQIYIKCGISATFIYRPVAEAANIKFGDEISDMCTNHINAVANRGHVYFQFRTLGIKLNRRNDE